MLLKGLNYKLVLDQEAETKVPDPNSTQQLNSYSYARANPLRFSDPNGLSVTDNINQFMSGSNNAYYTNYLNGYGRSGNNNTYYTLGQKFGDSITITQGVLEMIGGAIGLGGGGALTTTGIGVPAGAVAIIGSSAALAHGSQLIGTGIYHLSQISKNSEVNFAPGKSGNSVENAEAHFQKHKADFPKLSNASEYAQVADDFVNNPPSGSFVKNLQNNRSAVYDPRTNTIGFTANSTPSSMFKPSPDVHGFATNKEYFDSLK
jgi:pyocin large subunit-like protein